MVVVTGGAGFIGSCCVWELNKAGICDILIVDHLGSSDKWKNLVGLSFLDYIDKDTFLTRLESRMYDDSITAIVHFGACSATTEKNADYLMENNYRYTLRMARWWEMHQSVRFIYASSAATYGNGEHGYDDDESKLDMLRPLNMYGYSKHLFDQVAFRRGWLGHIVGLKFFNVFGPGEYHKGEMQSVIAKAYSRVRDEGIITLFKSYRLDYRDGEQNRDFIYVKDAIAMVLWFLSNTDAHGIYNIGTGRARSWNDLAHAMFKAAHKSDGRIEYIEMPESLRKQYQYTTTATLTKLRLAGCTHECLHLEASIEEYIQEYLAFGKTHSAR